MIVRSLLLIFLIVVIYVANAFANPIPRRKFDKNFKPIYGTSYSFEQAGWYGLDGRQNYLRMLEDFKFDWVRLSFFWDQMALLRSDGTSEGQARYEFNDNFDDLKFAIDEARKRNVKVIVAIGVKTPYFPEYHWPKDVAAKVKFGQRITADHPVASDILEIDRKVVEALSAYDNIAYWQVENEPLVGNVNKWKIDPGLIAKEVEIVRSVDPQKRPIILNHAAVGFYDRSWLQLLPILKPGDVFAVNAFFKTKGKDLITAKIFGRELHILWPDHLVWPVHSWGILSPNFESIKKRVEANGNKFWVLEVQAEPYIKKLEEADDPFLSFSARDIEAVDGFLKSYRFESVGLWGVHFWQYRAKHGDSSWIKTVSGVISP